jgi:SAM-dependent methyltransferase
VIARGLRYLRRQVVRLGPRAWVRFLRERTSPFVCPVCGARVDLFTPLFENLRLLEGAGYDYTRRGLQTLHWNAYSCPRCAATDRDRLMALYLQTRSNELCAPGGRMLDIAPSPPLSAHVRGRYPAIAYRTADLQMKGVDDRVDVTAMTIYEDASFGWLLCSHVLEHVADDAKAIAELWRVLKPGGWALVLVPIDLSLQDVLEEPVTSDPTLRWRLYAQGDHVRMYSHAGLVQRLEAAGFRVSIVTAKELGDAAFYAAGIFFTSALFVASKPAAAAAAPASGTRQP